MDLSRSETIIIFKKRKILGIINLIVADKKYLILGTNSFLANHIARQLCFNRSVFITGVYKNNRHKMDPDLYSRVISYSSLNQLKDEYDQVFILAGYVPYGKMDVPGKNLIEGNVIPVLDVHKLFPSSKIVLASSVSVYGENNGVIKEDSYMDKPSLYALSKLAAETIALNHPRYSVIRFSSIYGLGMNVSTFIPKIIDSAINKRQIVLFGDGKRKQDYIHVSDAARLMVNAGEHDINNVFLGVSGTPVSNEDVAKMVQSIFPGIKIEFEGEDKTPSKYYDASKTRNILNFECKMSMLAGLKEFIK